MRKKSSSVEQACNGIKTSVTTIKFQKAREWESMRSHGFMLDNSFGTNRLNLSI